MIAVAAGTVIPAVVAIALGVTLVARTRFVVMAMRESRRLPVVAPVVSLMATATFIRLLGAAFILVGVAQVVL